MTVRVIEQLFPNGKGEISITSPIDYKYNCIAWAGNDTTKFWWPLYPGYWPPDVPRETTVAAFKQAYQQLGYEDCSDGSLDPDFEKIAIYVDAGGIPTHAARQLKSGQWTSKLGPQWDISHAHCSSLEGNNYGQVAFYMRRKS